MHNVLEFSSVVDRLRSNSGSALKSLQRNFEETALKAAGLGEDEEALYKLGKHTQTYLRAVDAMHQAAFTLADDFTEAVEDIALRDVARKFRSASKSTNAQQLAALNRELGKPVQEACNAGDDATRQKLIGKAFTGLLDANLECFRAASTSCEEAFSAAQQVLKDSAKPQPTVARQTPAAPVRPAAAPAPTPSSTTARRATAPAVPDISKVSSAPLDDLLDFGGGATMGISSAKGSGTKGGSNLLDFDDFGTIGKSGHGTNGTSSPPQRASTSFDDLGSIQGDGTSPLPHRASTSSIPFDFDFNSPGPTTNGYSAASPAAAGVSSIQSTGSCFGLDSMSWPTKEEEDESCIKARVEAWQDGKNIRTMLVSLHEVAPSCSGWTPVKFDEVEESSDVKSVYRRAVLAVHPDKHNDKGGEKILGDLVFKALRDSWNAFRASN